MNRCRVSFIASLLAFAPLIVASQVVSSPTPIVSMTVGKVTALLDTHSGRFGIIHADGRTLLWRDSHNLTSHLSVSIGGKHWSNYRWAVLGRDPRMTHLGKGTYERLPDRLRYSWLVNSRASVYAVIEELIPVSAAPWNEVRVRVRVENRTGAPATVGLAVQMDVTAAGNDAPLLLLETAPCTTETVLANAAVPARWSVGGGIFAPDTAVGRIEGEGVTRPDVFISGQWRSHGALGTALCGERGMPGRSIDDAAVYLEWGETTVPASGAREEGTALGFRAADPPPAPTSFGTHFVVSTTRTGTGGLDCLLLASAEDTDVHVRYIDHRTTNFMPRDTIIPLKGGIPDTVCFTAYHFLPSDPGTMPDSLHYHQCLMFHLDGTRPFGVVVMGGWADATLAWPAEAAGREYVLPGGLGNIPGNICAISTVDSAAEIRVYTRALGMKHELFNRTEQYPRNTWLSFHLPPRSWARLIAFDTSSRNGYSFNPRLAPPDNNGSIIASDAPIHVWQVFWGSIPFDSTREWSGGNLRTTHWRQYNIDDVPALRRLGREYVFVPYEKRGALRNEDMLRIVAAYDSTLVFLGDSTLPRLLGRGDRIDTLLAVPLVVTASKPVMAYQFAAFWFYTNPWDSAATAGVVALHPTALWGREYYGFAGTICVPFLPYEQYPLVAYHRIRVYTRAGEEDSVTLNGARIPAAQFRSGGGFAWYDVEMPFGPAVVRSARPCLMLVYGWRRGTSNTIYHDITGVAYIPPFR